MQHYTIIRTNEFGEETRKEVDCGDRLDYYFAEFIRECKYLGDGDTFRIVLVQE